MHSFRFANEKEIIQQLSIDTLNDFLVNIAQEQRLSGSPEELRTFRYIEQKLRSFGLETTLSFSPGYISLPRVAALSVAGVSYPCITASMSAPTGEAGITAEMLYVGDLDALEALSGKTRDKILIFKGFAGRAQAQKAAESGAVACIFVNGERVHNTIISPVWGNPTHHTFPYIPKISIVSVNKNDGEQLVRLASERAVAQVTTSLEVGWKQIPTLTATIKGQAEPDKFILFSGHVDSWHLGAMDNGSANAAMMEIARVLSEVPLRRTLKLAFWSGHSHGRYAGSTNYMDRYFRDIYDNCCLHINIDSVGAIGSTVITEGEIMPLTRALAAEVIKEQTDQDFRGRRFGRGGDQSFWGAGIPSAFMSFSNQPHKASEDDLDTQYVARQFNCGTRSSGLGWWWHSNEDTLDKIDMNFLLRDTRVYLSFIIRSCNTAIMPLDLAAGINDLKEHLESYRFRAKGHISLDEIDSGLQELSGVVDDICHLTACLEDTNGATCVNNAIQAVARVIVRLLYAGVSEFDPDAALPMPALPLLAGINRLDEASRDEHAYYMLLTEIQRRVNQTAFLLSEGAKAARHYLRAYNDGPTRPFPHKKG